MAVGAALVVDLLLTAGSGGDLDAPARRRPPGAGARTARCHQLGGASVDALHGPNSARTVGPQRSGTNSSRTMNRANIFPCHRTKVHQIDPS